MKQKPECWEFIPMHLNAWSFNKNVNTLKRPAVKPAFLSLAETKVFLTLACPEQISINRI